MADDELAPEIVSEHHDRITEAEHEAEAAAEQAKQAEEHAFDIAAELGRKSDIDHEHPAYVKHDELTSLLDGYVKRAEEAAVHAEEAAMDAAEQPEEAETAPPAAELEPEVAELPLPEPEPEPVRYERRHGRYHQRAG